MSERQETSVTSISVLQKVTIKWEEGLPDRKTKRERRRRNVKMKPICPPDDKRRWTMFRCHLHTLSLLYGLQHVKHKSDTYIKHTDTQYWRMTITITTGGERCETTYTHTLHCSLTLIFLGGERHESWFLSVYHEHHLPWATLNKTERLTALEIRSHTDTVHKETWCISIETAFII